MNFCGRELIAIKTLFLMPQKSLIFEGFTGLKHGVFGACKKFLIFTAQNQRFCKRQKFKKFLSEELFFIF